MGNYFMLPHTRPNISFSMNYLSRFMSKPSKIQFSGAKRVVRYLAGTKDVGFWYSLGDEDVLKAFSDSNWGGSRTDRKSTTGCCFD